MGRPREYDREALSVKFEQYINDTEVPIIAEFSYLNDVPRDLIYQWEEFLTLLNRCIAKKETALERGMLSSRYPPAAAIFSLKQLGWTDKVDTTHRGDKNAPLQFSQADKLV